MISDRPRTQGSSGHLRVYLGTVSSLCAQVNAKASKPTASNNWGSGNNLLSNRPGSPAAGRSPLYLPATAMILTLVNALTRCRKLLLSPWPMSEQPRGSRPFNILDTPAVRFERDAGINSRPQLCYTSN